MSAAAIPLKSATFLPRKKNEDLLKHGPIVRNWFELIIKHESERKKSDVLTQYFQLRDLPDGDMERVEGKISASVRIGTESEEILQAVRALGLAVITVLNKVSHHYILCAGIPRSQHLIVTPLSSTESSPEDVDRARLVVERAKCATLLAALYG